MWVLHDGPPYANGPVHMGHAVNKILKDITNRWKVTSGYRCHYVPGWDCHGLPIELKALSKSRSSRNKDPLSVRALSRNFAIQAIEEQKSQFVSWGVMADWTQPYLTMDSHFVKAQLKLFYKLYSNGCVYQRFMPVYWSPSSQTALAESELEYNSNHVSTAIYIRFPVVTATIPSSGMPSSSMSDLYFLSWTTTPWSIAANRAIAFNADAEYVIVQDQAKGKNYIVASDLLCQNQELVEIFGSDPKIIHRFKNAETMADLKYTHPLNAEIEMKIYAGSHVTLNAGTGLVHTAPAHGQEDYLLGLEHDLDLSCPVNEIGKYDSTVIHPKLEGLDVLGRGNDVMLQLLHQNNHILKQSKFVHSYPYDWRTKKPVILRASRQWFMDTKSLQVKALEAIKNDVEVTPMSSASGFESILRARPYWCISRQRVWGVPIPVFYNQDNEQVIVNENVIDQLCHLVDEHDNIDFWWKWDDSTLRERLKIPENVVKGKDILDVWFDSGVTWNAVLPSSSENGNGRVQKADLYLEGLDQFSGWFYSSLLTSLGSQEEAAYKKIFVHGFALDENGRKMSKSLGNVIAPSSITSSGQNSFGVDVLRYWVAAHASSSTSVPVSDKILQMTSQDVDRTRNALRYIISNLDAKDELVLLELKDLKLVDQYILHCMSDFCQTLAQHYEAMAYNKVCQSLQHFIANDLSAFFFTIIKDRLYCEAKDSPSRKSALTTLFWIGKYLRVYLKPILPILSYEVLQHCSILDQASTLKFTDFQNDNLKDRFQDIIAIRRCLNQHKVKKSDCVNVGIDLGLSLEDLAEIWQVAFVTQNDADNLKRSTTFDINGIPVDVTPSGLKACPRCRLFRSPTEEDLCERCQQVVNSITVINNNKK